MKAIAKKIAALLLASIIVSACASDHNHQYQTPQHPKANPAS
jgi:hypothetical protein